MFLMGLSTPHTVRPEHIEALCFISVSPGCSVRRGMPAGGSSVDLICYLHPGWEPLIRPAEATRPWMDATPEAFAYRCLPLNIANAHGWEILCPCDVTAYWTGGARVEDVVVRPSQPGPEAPVSLFGQGVLTFHVQALFRTPPGWDLWISGSPNRMKDGIAPLTGIVETDWSPYTFTMNWKFTRRNHWVQFKKNEPICFVFPLQRHAVESMEPKFVRLEPDGDIAQQFRLWSESRNAFHAEMADGRDRAPSEKWQKRYYRGVTMRSDKPTPGHRTKLRLQPFTHRAPAEALPASFSGLDEMQLGQLLSEVAGIARRGEDAGAIERALRDAGLPAAAASRMASSLSQAAETDNPALARDGSGAES
jgi:hypothetical protein